MVEGTLGRLGGEVVVGGGGRVGRVMAGQLEEAGVAFVVIDPDAERVAGALERAWMAIEGDATEDNATEDDEVDDDEITADVFENFGTLCSFVEQKF